MTTEQMQDLGLMNPQEATFSVSEGGFANLLYKGTEYKHIILRRILPTREPHKYISIADHENKEIAILENIADLPPDYQRIVNDQLDARYYCPQIADVVSVQDKLGYVYMEMTLINKQGREYKKNLAVKDVSRNIRMLSDTSIIIFDVDGNRYICNDLSKLSKQCMRKLDAYLF